jgi:ABC-type uncharacterized transport system substrate-binding protein
MLAEAFGKPVIGSNAYNPRYGMLSAVVKTGQEQGQTAAEMLLKAMQGTPVADIPMTQNQYGRKVVNVDVVKSLGIKASATVLRGVELVKTE